MSQELSVIKYRPDDTISYNSQTYNYAVTLSFTTYKLDKYGRVDNSNVENNRNLKVRGYYTADGLSSVPNKQPLTIEDLVTILTTKRASAVEREIEPLSSIIEYRNKRIDNLGTLLTAISQTQAQLESQEEGKDAEKNCVGLCYYLSKYFTTEELTKANLLTFVNNNKSSASNECKSKKSQGYIAAANQLVKAKIDALNNDASADLSRMDNLVNKRDESYSLSTDLLGKISDGRSTIINNMN